MGLSLVTTCNCHSQHPSPFSCPPSVMHSKADAVLIRRCGKSNLHTESQLANDLAIFGANCVAKRGRGGEGEGGGGKTHLPCKPQAESPKSSSATAQLITEANREHLRVVASSTASPQSGRRGRGRCRMEEW